MDVWARHSQTEQLQQALEWSNMFQLQSVFFLLFCSKQNWDEEDVIELGLSALHLADISYSNGVKVEKGEIGKMFKVSQIVSCLASY